MIIILTTSLSRGRSEGLPVDAQTLRFALELVHVMQGGQNASNKANALTMRHFGQSATKGHNHPDPSTDATSD